MPDLSDDIVAACAHLADRSGASGFEIGHMHDDVPVEEAGWYATVTFQGARITVDEHRSPTAAALALAERLLSGATCRCMQPVSLSNDRPGCRWRLMGDRWTPGCDAAPIHVAGGQRGDYTAIQAAMAAHGNRATRRAAKRRK